MSDGRIEILTGAEMASIDRRTIDEFGVPAIVLMENAGIAIADFIEQDFDAGTISVVSGSGNNGGDGFVIARQLHTRGCALSIVRLGSMDSMSDETRSNLESCQALGIDILEVSSDESLDDAAVRFSESDLIVDAIFGTGLDRPAEGLHASIIDLVNATGVPVVSVDLPSGLDGSSHRADGPAVQATATVALARPKIANVLDPAAQLSGELVIANISIPDEAVSGENTRLWLLTAESLRPELSPRPADSHKGTLGHVGILAGSTGKTGAAILAARGAHRSGAGLVTISSDADSQPLIAGGSAESMTLVVHTASSREILDALQNRDVAAIGPGLSAEAPVLRAVREAILQLEIPTVIDATALAAFAGDLESLKARKAATVLTPHPGEMSRLLDRSVEEITADRLGAVRDAARASGAIVVLKGHQTLVSTPDGDVSLNPTGNPGMATGGMGDVLTGVVAALLARSSDPYRSVCAAVFVHGLAGDLVAEDMGETGMTALDLADRLPEAFQLLAGES